MKGSQIFLDHLKGREVAALVDDGQLQDLFIETGSFSPGSIFRGKANRPAKGQGGIFLSMPQGKGFLRQTKGVSQGQTLIVQVSGFAESGKAIPVTTKLLFKGRFVIVTPDAPGLSISRSIRDKKLRDRLDEFMSDSLAPCEYGIILRSNCLIADFKDILDDAQRVLKVARTVMTHDDQGPSMLLQADGPHRLAWREWGSIDNIQKHAGCIEESGIIDQIEALHCSKIEIGSFNYFIEKTRALTSIDVNTGVDSSFAAGLKANFAMVRDLPRQLRLRGLGGQIVIDPAPMPKKYRNTLESALKSALTADGIQTRVLGWTALGLIELQRARTRAPFSL